MTQQCTDTIMMVKPAAFGYNAETAENNYYQKESTDLTKQEVQERAMKEFNAFVEKLRNRGVDIIVVEDTAEPVTPDAIFPNNWVSFHENGDAIWYPMFSPMRRNERRGDVMAFLKNNYNYQLKQIHDLSILEADDVFLEGTGSLVLDRVNKIAYAAISNRTHKQALFAFTKKTGYKAIDFEAFQTVDGKRLPIYHTNVMMSVGEKVAIVCLDAVDKQKDKETLLAAFKKTNKEIVEITEEQCNSFAGNMLEVKSKEGEAVMVMSLAAYNSLNQDQIEKISKHCDILHSSLETIEMAGGGSARCMMAEVFLPRKTA